MTQAQVIGILGAVVAGGLAYWKFKGDEPVDVVPVTAVAPTTTAPECSDDMGCTSDKPHCNPEGKCVSATEYFTSSTGSLYPAYGGSDLQKPEARKTIIGKEACAKTCYDDPDCVAFTHWEERYTEEHPMTDGEPTHPDNDLCYFWSGPNGDDLTLTPTAAVGPADEGNTEDIERANSKATTYIKTDKKDYVPEEETQTSDAEQVSAPADYTPMSYQPSSNSIQFDPKSRPGNCF